MNIGEFFNAKHVNMRPIFVTKKDIKVPSYVWEFGHDPHQDKKMVTIPKGTKLVICGYSNLGNGYSMHPLQPRKTFKGLNKMMSRWIPIKYTEMEYHGHEIVTNKEFKKQFKLI